MEEKYKTKEAVHNRAKEAVGKPMITLNGGKPLSGKSGPGDAFENWFGKPKDSLSEPDMREAGVDLKATPIKKLKSGEYSSKERLVLNIINYVDLANEEFETSHFVHKNKAIELAFYEYLKNVPKDQWSFKEVALYEMRKNPVDYEIIKHDWHTIQKFVLEGKAEQLRESVSEYLAPCTKGANAQTVRKQPYSDKKAKQRAFSLKSGYMTHLLQAYVLGNKHTESIFKDTFDSSKQTLDERILEKLNKWQGFSVKDLKAKFGVTSTSKAVNYILVSKMLGLRGTLSGSKDSNNVAEFEKANIILKTIHFDAKGYNKESMSFPSFKFKDLGSQEWNDEDGDPSAEWHNFLLESKFLFVVFQEIDAKEVFVGAKFFAMPSTDIEGDVKAVWQDTVFKINNGVELHAKQSKNKAGYIINNNFIKRGANKICHVRPHARNRDYSAQGKYSDQLPHAIKWLNRPADHQLYSDDWMTTQCFWLNNSYIKEQVKDLLVVNK